MGCWPVPLTPLFLLILGFINTSSAAYKLRLDTPVGNYC